MDEREIEEGPTLDRLVFLSDGVFAIAITLLVLDIGLPDLLSAADLSRALVSLLPQIATYALSFIIISLYWQSHQRIFRYIKRATPGLVWVNALFLMSIAFLPVPSRILGQYGAYAPAFQFYSLSQMAAGVAVVGIWWYATWHHRLVDPTLSPKVIRQRMERLLAIPTIFAIAFVLAFVGSSVGEVGLVVASILVSLVVRSRR